MAATVSAWSKPGAWALDSEENESELLQQHKEASTAMNGGDKEEFPSLSAAASKKTKKKKAQTLSLSEFSAYSAVKPAAYQVKGLTTDEQLALPTGPRERSAEELDRSKLGGGFRSYGGGMRDETRRQGSFNRDSDREFVSSRADETDNWAADKKFSASSNGFEKRERGERGGFFPDSQSRADDVDNWSSRKSFVPSEPRRFEKKPGFGFESSNSGGSDGGNWAERKISGAFDSMRDRRGGFESNRAPSEDWGRKREEESVGNGGGRPRLNLKPRTLPVGEEQKNEISSAVKPKANNPFGAARPREEVLKEKGQDWKEIAEQKNEIASVVTVKPKSSNPFGAARPREDVLKEKGQDWKEIDEKLESTKINESTDEPAVAKLSFGSWTGRDRLQHENKTERAWRMPGPIDSRPQSASEMENGIAENGHASGAEQGDTQM